ncbi:MAG: hypothetical protein GX846_10365 [Deltaproteobacteria bacterium]|nr:hypothetical protein [Deltaproteobacteria bacterium]
MKLHCPECKSKYSLDTSKIPVASDKGITETCPKCKHKFPLTPDPEKAGTEENIKQEILVPCPSSGHISISQTKCPGCGKVFTREDMERLKITIKA